MKGPASSQGVACPSCGKPSSLVPSNRWRPFCSERCRLADMGAWASETYRVPGKAPSGEGGPEGGGPEA